MAKVDATTEALNQLTEVVHNSFDEAKQKILEAIQNVQVQLNQLDRRNYDAARAPVRNAKAALNKCIEHCDNQDRTEAYEMAFTFLSRNPPDYQAALDILEELDRNTILEQKENNALLRAINWCIQGA